MTETQVGQSQELTLRRGVAQQIAKRLGQQSLVTSIIVFGSVATGIVDGDSDVDLLVICQPQVVPPAERKGLLVELGAGWMFDIPPGNILFASMDEGDMEGIAVTVHYPHGAWIDAVLDEVLGQGTVTSTLLPFRPYTLPALLQHGWLLVDKEQQVARWRARSLPYPSLLKHNIVQHFMPILQEQTDELVLTARRRIGPHVFLFHLNRAVDALISILYAHNEVYDPADRRAEQTVWPLLVNVPIDFVARLNAILAGPFDGGGMEQRAHDFRRLAQEVIMQTHIS